MYDLKVENNHNYILSNDLVVHNSGKGFVIKKFMEGEKFKVLDVDALKVAFLKLAKIKDEYSELRGLDLRSPKDVFFLHTFIKNKGIKDKTIDLLLSDHAKDRLPNLIFDITLKDIEDVTDYLPLLKSAGYEDRNINIIWVLTNYSIAVEQNRNRSRVVPEDVLLKTHEGAAKSMYSILSGKFKNLVDGAIYVVLNNKENTIRWKDKNGVELETIRDFKYLTVKQPGKPIESESNVKTQIFQWIVDNIPKTKKTQDIFGDIKSS